MLMVLMSGVECAISKAVCVILCVVDHEHGLLSYQPVAMRMHTL